MPTVNYSFEPNQPIYVIVAGTDGVLAVRSAMVLRVRVDVLVTTTKLVYDVKFSNQVSTVEVMEDDMFSTLSDAINEYELRLS